jgi:hypothetical protein
MEKIRIDHSECELNMSSYKNLRFMCETISNGNDDGLSLTSVARLLLGKLRVFNLFDYHAYAAAFTRFPI